MFCLWRCTKHVLVEDSLIHIHWNNARAFDIFANHGYIQTCTISTILPYVSYCMYTGWLSCHEVGWMAVVLLVSAAKPESLRWCFNICKREATGYLWRSQVTPPSQLLFEPKSNQTVSTAMLQHKIQNWTQRNVKLQHKVTEWRNLSVFASLFSSLHRYLSLSPSLCLSLTPPPLTFQHHPLLLPPDKASIVSQMLFNMESLSLCPSYRAIHMAKSSSLRFTTLCPIKSPTEL